MLLLALAVLAATPLTLPAVINAAKPGDTIRLVAGRYPQLTFKNRTWVPAITVDATAARATGVKLSNVGGFAWSGGEIAGVVAPGTTASGDGFKADYSSRDISVTGVHFSDLRNGVVFEVTGGKIVGNWMTRMSSDGINVGMSRNIVIDRNACSDFAPGPGAHPDCIQLVSKPTGLPTADIAITNNSAVGAMQGIGLFNHVRNGVDDGGFDRIIVRGNKVLNTFSLGIAIGDCRGCVVRDNDVNSLPNYIFRAQLSISGGSVTACGNVVPMVPRQGTPPCKD